MPLDADAAIFDMLMRVTHWWWIMMATLRHCIYVPAPRILRTASQSSAADLCTNLCLHIAARISHTPYWWWYATHSLCATSRIYAIAYSPRRPPIAGPLFITLDIYYVIMAARFDNWMTRPASSWCRLPLPLFVKFQISLLSAVLPLLFTVYPTLHDFRYKRAVGWHSRYYDLHIFRCAS